MKSDTMKATSIQIPPALYEKLRRIAAKEGRSLSSQIRFFLAESVTRQNAETRKSARA